MKGHWAERAYALLVAMYPKSIRDQHSAEMRLVFRDLLRDPEVQMLDLARRVLGDMRYLIGGAFIGALFGIEALAIWFIVRSDIVPFGRLDGIWLIALLFVGAGLTGTLRTGTVAGGLWTGLVAGIVSALTVPGEYWLFHNAPFYDVFSFVAMSALEGALVMFLAGIGALLPSLPRHRHRVGRSVGAFFAAWRQIPS
jgi:hypothetical protein